MTTELAWVELMMLFVGRYTEDPVDSVDADGLYEFPDWVPVILLLEVMVEEG